MGDLRVRSWFQVRVLAPEPSSKKSPTGDFFVLLFCAGRTRRPEETLWESVSEAGSRVAQRTCDRVLPPEQILDKVSI